MTGPIPTLGATPLPDSADLHRADLQDAARDFEGLLLGIILRGATRPIGGSSLLDGGSAGRMYRELLFEEIAVVASRRGELGVARLIESQLAQPSAEEER